jgi:coenzyme Q-binding protein COQ10
MTVISVSNRSTGPLPYTREQAFDLAADIERYPEFLKGCVSACVQRRESDVCYVEQVIGLGPVRWRFTSKAVLHRPERIEVTSTESPFRLFSLSWLIAALPSTGCRVSVAASIELESRILQAMMYRFLPAAVDEVITAFEARAHRLYADRDASIRS